MTTPETMAFDEAEENQPGYLDWVALVDEDDAAKSLERIEQARTDLARIKAAAEVRIQEYTSRLAHVESYETPRLADWFDRNRPAKKKSINLETGTLGERKKAGGLRVRDKDTVRAWAQVNCKEAVTVREVFGTDKKRLDAYLERTGDVPDGCELVDDTVTFYVRGPK